MNILWLTSWYPNRISPFDGDFIQRHALAVASCIPLTVIYVAQYGESVPVNKGEIVITNNGNLKEIVIFFSFKRTGIKIIDKMIYNWKYYSAYKKYIRQHFAGNGLPDMIHVHVPMKAGTIAQWIKSKWHIPYIVSEHSATYVPGPPDSFKNRSLYYRKRVASVFRKASAVTSVSQHDGYLIKKIFSLKEVNVIRNVVDTDHFYYEGNSKNDPFSFIHVSAMNYQKNIEGIIAAFDVLAKQRKDWRLQLIGNDSNDIKKMITAAGIQDKVLLPGEISNAAVAQQMQRSNALVMFSRYENFPCVIIEALCCGLPVIASRVAGIPEAVNDSNGILVDNGNVQQLAEALAAIMEVYERFNRKEIAAHAASQYNYGLIARQFISLYKTVLTETDPPST